MINVNIGDTINQLAISVYPAVGNVTIVPKMSSHFNEI